MISGRLTICAGSPGTAIGISAGLSPAAFAGVERAVCRICCLSGMTSNIDCMLLSSFVMHCWSALGSGKGMQLIDALHKQLDMISKGKAQGTHHVPACTSSCSVETQMSCREKAKGRFGDQTTWPSPSLRMRLTTVVSHQM